MKEYQIKQDK